MNFLISAATISTLFLTFAATGYAEWVPATDAPRETPGNQLLSACQTPPEPRRLLIFNRNLEYDGHKQSIARASRVFAELGRQTGDFEATVTEDPAFFDKERLARFDAVFLNNTIGTVFPEADRRRNLLEFVTGGGGLMGVHGTSVAFTKWQWPPLEDWEEFGRMLGARGANHRHGYLDEPIVMALDDPGHPLLAAFEGRPVPWSDEIFRFHAPYSRDRVRVLLRIDAEQTDLSTYPPGDSCLRHDNDYALAWIRNYGKGRIFYSALGHSPKVFDDPAMRRFHLDGIRFVLGALPAPTTPSSKLNPSTRAMEKLGWRIDIEAYTFHKFTFFEAIEKTAELGLAYIGGLSFMQQVSEDIPKNFDQHLSDDELLKIRLKLDGAGLRMPVYYAQNIPFDEAACRKLFEFGNRMGVETFICEPKAEQLELLDSLANEYGINIGLHNHGPDISPHLWQPEMVLALCEGRSKRIGAAPDLGYWLRAGIDPVEAVGILKDRILTIQMHDLHEPGPNGHDVAWGTGTGKAEEFFRELHKHGLKPTMIGIEFSRNWFESMPDLRRSIDFFNQLCVELATEK